MDNMGFGDNDMQDSEKLDRILYVLREIKELLGSGTTARSEYRVARAFPSSGGSAAGMLPNYGRAKGQPIAGASLGDLEYYAEGCRKSLNDPSKERFHEQERATLAALEAELGKHGR